MDYEKLHKDTINKLQEMVNSGKITVETARGICADFVPESEDERIRKELIEFVKSRGGFKQEYIAWLEKQGEHANFRNKIQIGDKVTRNEDGVLVNLSQLKRVAKPVEPMIVGQEPLYDYTNANICQKDFAEKKPAWSEEDELHIRELESLVKQVWATAEHGNDKDTIHKMSDLLFFLKTLKPQLKQEWSEEDESRLDIIFERIERGLIVDKDDIDRLKSLKDRYTWKPSDEQMNALNYVVNLMASSERPTENDLYYNILKSLRQQLMKLKG